ncbi:MAG TPA: tetratricopeptide repeat protein [Candidatus Limnocylindria bacterium]
MRWRWLDRDRPAFPVGVAEPRQAVGGQSAAHPFPYAQVVSTRTVNARRVRQRAKGPIDPAFGERVRSLRQGRRLTQAALAGDDFTTGFISLVETGRTRISLRAAEIFARRLGVAVSELMVPSESAPAVELELLQSERALLSGNGADALEAAERAHRRSKGLDRARAVRARGRALLKLGRAQEALAAFDNAARDFRTSGAHDLAARTLLDMAHAYRQLDAPGEALRVAVQCDTALQTAQVVDRTLELQVLLFLANAFVRMGDYASANASAERALQVARDVGDAGALAELYAGLALTRHAQGDSEAAVSYTARSLHLYEQLGRERAVAEAWNTAGWVAINRREYRRAKEALDRADALAARIDHGELAALIIATRAELALAQDKAEEAVRLAEQSLAHPRATRYARGNATLIRARALSASRTTLPRVVAAFEQAIKANAGEPQARRAEVHEAYADALAARNQTQAAFEQSKRALALTRPASA